jgi:predicted esterase
MSLEIIKRTIENEYFSFNAMAFVPTEHAETRAEWALFTHGYTASKSDCLNWAQRLSEVNIPSVIFDLPGHHLGSFNSVESFEDFTEHSHECFNDAFEFLKEILGTECKTVILGGHSLGAMLSIKALKNTPFSELNRLAVAIGIGIGQHKTVHLFESSFYQKTLQVRRQLVDPHLDSDVMFPWIKQEKLDTDIAGERIHLITGEDDVVVGEGGMEAFRFNLESLGNNVTFNEPRKLAHHEPSKAATHIYNFLKKELSL